MTELAELNTAGLWAGFVSAALLLFALWRLLRFRPDPGNGELSVRPKPELVLEGGDVDGPPSPLAFTASVFFHLVALSLLPYAGIVMPGIVIRPASTKLVLIDYRVAGGTFLAAPWQPLSGLIPQAEENSGESASGPREIPPNKTLDAPAAPSVPDPPEALRASEVTRFDAVVRLSPPGAQRARAVGELAEGPAFVLDWRTPRTRPGLAVLAEIAALTETHAMIGRFREMSESRARERFSLYSASGEFLGNRALAEYSPPMKRFPAETPDSTILHRWQSHYTGYILLRLDGHVRGRRRAYLASSLLVSRAGTRMNPDNSAGHPSAGEPGGPDQPAGAQDQILAWPLERRRHGIMLVGPGARGQIPEADGWFSGHPIYTVYLTVAGSTRKWVLQFCRPGGESRRLDLSKGVIHLRPRRALTPPFARRTHPLGLNPRDTGPWARAVVFATLDRAGRLADLKIIAGPRGEIGEHILASLREWEFLPAFEDGKPVSVEAIFSIPLK